jgi:hypothetical protein
MTATFAHRNGTTIQARTSGVHVCVTTTKSADRNMGWLNGSSAPKPEVVWLDLAVWAARAVMLPAKGYRQI